MWKEGVGRGCCDPRRRWRGEGMRRGLTDLQFSTPWELLRWWWLAQLWSGQTPWCSRKTSAGKWCRKTWIL